MKYHIIIFFIVCFYRTLTPMSDTNHIVCFFNKNVPECSLRLNLLNIETGTYTHCCYKMKPGQKRIFDFRNIIIRKKPKLLINTIDRQKIKFKINDASNNMITIAIDDSYITIKNQENTLLAQSIRTDQANSSRSCEEVH